MIKTALTLSLLALAVSAAIVAGTAQAQTMGPHQPSAEPIAMSPKIKAQLRAAYLRGGGRSLRHPAVLSSFPRRWWPRIRRGRIGPLSGKNHIPARAARVGDTEWAVASFIALADQPEIFKRRVGQRRWIDLGDTGGLSCRPYPLQSGQGALKAMGVLDDFTRFCVKPDPPPITGLVKLGSADYRLADDGASFIVRAWVYSPPTTADCVVPVTAELFRTGGDGTGDRAGEATSYVDVCESGAREPWPGWLGRQAVLVVLPSEPEPEGAYGEIVEVTAGTAVDWNSEIADRIN